jgi:hypothetical protein
MSGWLLPEGTCPDEADADYHCAEKQEPHAGEEPGQQERDDDERADGFREGSKTLGDLPVHEGMDHETGPRFARPLHPARERPAMEGETAIAI